MNGAPRYKRWYTGMPIRFKLLFWFVPLLMATIVAMGWIAYEISSNEVMDKMKQTQNQLTQKTADQIDSIAKEMLFFSNNLFLDDEIQRLLESGYQPAERQKAFKTVSNMMVASDSIQSMILYTLKPGYEHLEPFAANQAGITSAMTLSRFMEGPYFDAALKAKGSPIYGLVKPSDGIFVGDHYHKIVLSRVIGNIYDLKPAGLIMIGVDAARIGRLYLGQPSLATEMFVISEDGLIITATDQHWIGKYDTELPYNGANGAHAGFSTEERLGLWKESPDWIITQTVSPSTGWHVVVVNTREKLVRELGRIGQLTVAVAVVCFIISLVVTWLLSNMITKPLMKLSRSMRKLQTGDFTQRVHFTGEDEIGELGSGYNAMVKRIKVLIDDVYATQLKQKKAELKTLQAQISPHFLYNTLNTISWTAEKKGEKDIADMVYSLSQVFRLSLNDGKDFFTIHQEMELVRNYLFLQKSRFMDRFDFSIEIEAEVASFMIPKLILQPLAENAIIHGIEPMNGSGFITLRAYGLEDSVVLEVLDNGIGIPEAKLHKLTSGLQRVENRSLEAREDELRTGFALLNIQERLRLFQTGAYLELDSKEGKGTRAVIHLERKGD
ncbi:cache domain-containing sensor histidine kinase [Paenibacillus lautus]|uniref:cache domain-containing sensor histidine kinase n=1 Tax=Paenibacillus lautus TaxID=1401 RepID=UPI003D2A63C7